MNQPTIFLRFDTEEQWREAALEYGILKVTEDGEDIWAYYTERWAIDDIGQFCDLVDPSVLLPGYCVNVKWFRPTLPASFVIHRVHPATPRRIFSGDDLEEIADRSGSAD